MVAQQFLVLLVGVRIPAGLPRKCFLESQAEGNGCQPAIAIAFYAPIAAYGKDDGLETPLEFEAEVGIVAIGSDGFKPGAQYAAFEAKPEAVANRVETDHKFAPADTGFAFENRSEGEAPQLKFVA